MKKYIMALDQGTTSSRAILFDRDGNLVSRAQREFPQIFPSEGWVEHDPMTIWSTQIGVAAEALLKTGGHWDEVAGIGITNQRETAILWNRRTGQPVYNAIVWQCRRTAAFCEQLKRDGWEPIIKQKTGLLIDPYFSASKIRWVLEHVEEARRLAECGDLCFGTVDSWLIYNLTGGKVHATDVSNASRTMLFNIHTLQYDEELLSLFGIPRSILPQVYPSSHIFGYTEEKILGATLPIGGVAGDQQASLFGQSCFAEGDFKNTYGTGAFLLMNTGDTPHHTDSGLLTTIAWQLGDKVTYALEGSVFTCGAAIQWLRDGMKMIESAQDSDYYARKVPDTGGVTVVPAFGGLGAPYWDPYARGTILGITRATTKAHVIRATLEAIAYQTADVMEMMERVTGIKIRRLKVDGGACANDFLMEFQADILGITTERPQCVETTALGAAYLCGLAVKMFDSVEKIKQNHKIEKSFPANHDHVWREEHLRTWRRAVARCLGWAKES